MSSLVVLLVIAFLLPAIAVTVPRESEKRYIITEKIKTFYFSGEPEKFQEEYEELPPLEKGVAKGIQRYRRRQKVFKDT
jgi:hypothetical protein